MKFRVRFALWLGPRLIERGVRRAGGDLTAVAQVKRAAKQLRTAARG